VKAVKQKNSGNGSGSAWIIVVPLVTLSYLTGIKDLTTLIFVIIAALVLLALVFWCFSSLLDNRTPERKMDDNFRAWQQSLKSPDVTTQNLPDVKTMSGIDFEQHCKTILIANGWRVNSTAATGDQGADLVVQGLNQKGVVQCKRWNSSIGNSAVQEAFAAKSFYSANFALVIGVGNFTKSAQELALKTGVNLIQISGLPSIKPNRNL
jgi:Restriction endonuclease